MSPVSVRRVEARGGWRFRVVCSVCAVEDTFDGFIHPQAVDRAVKAGWTVDPATARRPVTERTELCPTHRPTRRPLP